MKYVSRTLPLHGVQTAGIEISKGEKNARADAARLIVAWARIGRLLFGFQIAHQAGKRFLKFVVILPLPKISNVPHAPDIRCPSLVCFHDRIIQTDREEHGSILPALFLEGRFDL